MEGARAAGAREESSLSTSDVATCDTSSSVLVHTIMTVENITLHPYKSSESHQTPAHFDCSSTGSHAAELALDGSWLESEW